MQDVPKEYKRKRLAEEWAQDIKPKNFGNYFNKAERQRGKSLAVSGVEDHEDTQDQDLIRNLKWNLEEKYSSACYHEQKYGVAGVFADVLQKLGIGNFNIHICNCPNPDNMTDEEILKLSGF